jgi:hypothetical protein
VCAIARTLARPAATLPGIFLRGAAMTERYSQDGQRFPLRGAYPALPRYTGWRRFQSMLTSWCDIAERGGNTMPAFDRDGQIESLTVWKD